MFVVGPAGGGIAEDIYVVQGLVSDTSASAPATDPSLVNGWGLSAGPTSPWWVSNNGTNTSTLYNGSGAKQALTVAVPGGPTGTVFNNHAVAGCRGLSCVPASSPGGPISVRAHVREDATLRRSRGRVG